MFPKFQQMATCAAGEEPFSYQSVTVQQRMPIVLQGEFTFVRGLLSDPEAPQFTARVSCTPIELSRTHHQPAASWVLIMYGRNTMRSG
jgi:hypothetical protein